MNKQKRTKIQFFFYIVEVSLVYTKSGQGEEKKKNMVKASGQILCFSINFRFRKVLCSQEIDSVLFQVSQKFCVCQRILYKKYT